MEPGDLTGAILDGRYRVIEPIAEGAMGVVYRAERLKLGRIVAIKVLHDELPAELSSRKRFEIEAMAMAKLEHPHCAAVVDVGVHDDKPYVVMDFVSGSNLREVIADGPLPASRAVEIVRQVLSGLAHAHELGIIHRDIKPANIVLSQKSGLGDHAKILDFGLARFDTTQSITTGIVVGTPSYMAPEQIRGVAIDHRADIYACGVLLFELLTANKPFVSPKDDPIEVCSMHLKQPPPTLHSMQPGIEFGELEAIVARALAKKPDDRYATAVEFGIALEAIPTRRSIPPSAPIAVPALVTASESGWAVPADARSSLVPSTPAAARAPSAGSGSESASAAGPESMPESAAPSAAPSARIQPSPSSDPIAPPKPGLPSDFDLSRAIPREVVNAASTKGLGVGFDLSLAIPQAAVVDRVEAPPGPGFDLSLAIPQDQSPILERSGKTAGASGPSMSSSVDGGSPTTAGASPTVSSSDASSAAGGTVLGLAVVPAAPVRKSAEIVESIPSPDNRATVAFLGAVPAGPSPLAAPDAPVVAEPAVLPHARPARRLVLMIGGSVLGLIVLIATIVGQCGGTAPKPKLTADASVAAPKAPDTNLADQQIARANDLIASGQTNAALDQLLSARRVVPKDARLAYLAGKIYFERQWWTVGLKQFRDVLVLDPTYRADPEMIKIVLKAFITPAEYHTELATFLRDDIGAPAKQYLEETATTHPRAATRARAKAELDKMQ